MAEAVLEVALGNLSSFIQNELRPFMSFDQDLNRLSRTLTAIKATLEDAEEKQLTNRAIKDWLQKLKDAAHMLDDILDECATEALELEDGGLNCGLPGKLQTSCLSSLHPRHVIFRCKTAKKMKMIMERLDEIAEERHKFHLNKTVTERRTGVIDWRQTTSLITQPQVYGREQEENNIVDFLFGDASNSKDLCVYPILGVGGLGKTTLAQLIFKHERVVKHFEPRIWVCVSEDFSLKRMVKAITESVSGDACKDMELEPLQRRLQEMIQRKRYLLVLDDVWDHDQDNWQRLRCVLACGAKGASILVTSRLLNVATVMGTMPPHELAALSGNDCWELFKQRAFGPNEVEPEELVIVGKDIVTKCAGVPLAAIALGSLLRFKREERDWLSIKESNLWSLQDENSIMPALRLSYLNLPVTLRQCFAFCALFRKDAIMSKQFLIELWMANGFISSNETLEAEDICDQVWNELYWRSFFQDIKTNEFDTRFKMHDLVHDLAQSVAQEVCCIEIDNRVTSVPRGTRHLASCGEKSSFQLHQIRSLKSFVNLGYYGDQDQLPPHVLKCYSLRVIDCVCLKDLPTSIGYLKYLRYLNISYGQFKTLPKSLCKLRNLQILKLECCLSLETLPNCLKRLKALQHLCLRGCYSLLSLAPSIGELTSLKTLSIFIVGKETGFRLTELGSLKLKGELHIKHLERATSAAEAKEAHLGKKHLNQLLLSWDRNAESQLPEDAEQVLEVLQPQPYCLQRLGLGGYVGVQFPQWMASPSFKDLRYLLLVDCKNCLNLPPLWKLPSLKGLEISNINHVKYVDNESYESMRVTGGFVALELLLLDKLPSLIRLSREEGEKMFPHLSDLKISECPKLSLPCLPSLKKLNVRGKCHQGLLSSICNLRSLECLVFSGNDDELTCFPNGTLKDLTSLKTLGISHFSRIEVLTYETINLSAISELCFHNCDSLESLTDQVLRGLHSLKILKLEENRKFGLSAGFQYLTSLKQLDISGCPEVKGFPEALQHMTALQSLSLFGLPNLSSLPDWLGNLVLLESLVICYCPKLTFLPASIQSLRSLTRLSIAGCPELSKRCQRGTGQDWPLIAHVPQIDKCPFYTGFFVNWKPSWLPINGRGDILDPFCY